MRPFAYARPETVDEAIEMLGEDGATPLAGGTDLLGLLKSDVETASLLVDLKGLTELRGVREEEEELWLGALTTLEDLRTAPSARTALPALADAVAEHRSPQIRAMGTLGGDLCQRPRCWYYRSGFGLLARRNHQSMPEAGDGRYHAIFEEGPARFVSASRLAPALIAHGAEVDLAGPSGKRSVPLEDFFRSPARDDEREVDLRPGEIVLAVRVPKRLAYSAQYEVHPRRALDWPLSAAAVALETRAGKVVDLRVVLGHVAARPRVLEGALVVWSGQSTLERRAQELGRFAVEGARPLEDNRYKVQTTSAAVRRAVQRAHERLEA